MFFLFRTIFCKNRKIDVVDAGRVSELNDDIGATPAYMSWLIVLSGTFESSWVG